MLQRPPCTGLLVDGRLASGECSVGEVMYLGWQSPSVTGKAPRCDLWMTQVAWGSALQLRQISHKHICVHFQLHCNHLRQAARGNARDPTLTHYPCHKSCHSFTFHYRLSLFWRATVMRQSACELTWRLLRFFG